MPSVNSHIYSYTYTRACACTHSEFSIARAHSCILDINNKLLRCVLFYDFSLSLNILPFGVLV